jgi:hypothetical protein
MWPWADLGTLDEAALRRRGLQLRLADLWTPGQGGLAEAVVNLNDGCTASFVSDDGLLLTNHHCAYGSIQRNSTPGRDLLKDGFAARTRKDELPGHGAKIFVFVGQEDVTAKVLAGLAPDLADEARARAVEAREKALVGECEQRPAARCRISRENDGVRFLLLETREIRDVRLVAAPPAALGEYGGETDNFQWPRHTLDFALIRAYVGPDGKPAEPAPANVPYRPRRHLRLAPGGVAEGDLVMVLGMPGRTDRYATATALEEEVTWHYPRRRELFRAWGEVLASAAKEIPAARLLVASRRKGLDNALTHAEGMLAGFARRGILAARQAEEAAYRRWLAADPGRQQRFGGALDALTAWERAAGQTRDLDFLLRYLVGGVDLIAFAATITRWAIERQKPDAERERGYQDRDRASLLAALKHAQRSYHPAADQRAAGFFLERLRRLPAGSRLAALDRALGPSKVKAFVERLYRGSRLHDETVRVALFDRPLAELRKQKDPALELLLALRPELDAYEARQRARAGARLRLRPPYLASMVAFRGKQFYPDANLSPRASFAHVAGYAPRDGAWHRPFTTLSGLLAKHTGKDPFEVPAALREAVKAGKHRGHVVPALGDVPVCFLSNADTTGGNSGSPALNGRGEVVGLNFDRVYENVSGDFGYRRETSRNVMLDVRMIRFYLGEVMGAPGLLPTPRR